MNFCETSFMVGSGRTALRVGVLDTGDGLVVTILGGDRPHVGAVSAVPGGVSLQHPGHRDGELSGFVAEGIHRGTGVAAVVVAGVHVSGITRGEIAGILSMRTTIIDRIVQWYGQGEGNPS